MHTSQPSLSFTDAGSGPAIVLMHAFPLNRTIWKPLQSQLAASHRVLTVDFPGFGDSLPPRPFTMDSAADDLYTLLKELKALPCTFVGMSMGGYLGFSFVHRYPEALSKLVLIDTKASGDDENTKEGRDKMIASVRTGGSIVISNQMLPRLLADATFDQNPALVDELRSIIHRTSPFAIEYGLQAMRDRSDRTAVMKQIKIPTLLVVGEHDKVNPPAIAESMHQQIPGSKLEVIPRAGHVCAIEQPEAFSRVLMDFLKH